MRLYGREVNRIRSAKQSARIKNYSKVIIGSILATTGLLIDWKLTVSHFAWKI